MGTNVQEIWKPIKGYENLYEISNTGKIKSLIKNKLLVISYAPYGCLQLSNGRPKPYRIHRLVAEHFLENPENLKEVNHKDGDKKNNHVDNLEYVSHKRNMHHARAIGLMKNAWVGVKGGGHPKTKLYFLTMPDGRVMPIYGRTALSLVLNKSEATIDAYLSGRINTPKGYKIKLHV